MWNSLWNRSLAPAESRRPNSSSSHILLRALASARASPGSTFSPDSSSLFTHATPDCGMRVATTGLPHDMASICTIPKASVFCTLLRQNRLQAP